MKNMRGPRALLPEAKAIAPQAMTALLGARHKFPDAFDRVPSKPGLYAIYGAAGVWAQLGIEYRGEMPLYVGKAERDLAARELRTHFASDSDSSPDTGHSTVRRSFAALLREPLALTAVPRNKKNPGHYDKYSLDGDGDDRLTAWMRDHLEIAVWLSPHKMKVQVLRDIETTLLKSLSPPINIKDVSVPPVRLRILRSIMRREAEQWET